MPEIRLSDLMQEKQILSFELFPPKTEKGMNKLPDTIGHLKELNPAYISCTYGAGGSNIGANREVCRLVGECGVMPMTHFTVIRNTRDNMRNQLDRYLENGVEHILALRGDFPQGENSTCGDFRYATELVGFIRENYGDRFEIAVGASPEGHVASPDWHQDVRVLKMKQDLGADFIMTQLCWDMEQFKRWLDEIRSAGITMPVDVGIMPILDMKATINMALSRNGCVMERDLTRLISRHWIFPDPFDSAPKFEDPDREQKKADFKKAGIEYTIRQIETYRSLGINGIHLYALNKWMDVTEIVKACGL